MPLAALIALPAAAQADVSFNLGNPLLAGGQSTSLTALLDGRCTGVAISVNFAPDAIARAHESFCSDAALFLIPPAGLHGSQWGGSDVLFGSLTTLESRWSFDGPRSALPGFYTDSRPARNANLTGPGLWTIGWGNGWIDSTPVQYNNVLVTLRGLTAVPAPGAIPVLGLAALLSCRRRRP